MNRIDPRTVIAVVLCAGWGNALSRAQTPLSLPAPAAASQPAMSMQPPPVMGSAIPAPPVEAGDLRFPINLAAALRLADARPMIVAVAQSRAWVAEAQLQKDKVLWVPTLNTGFDYIRHNGGGPDLNNGESIPPGVNAQGQPEASSLGKPLNQNISFLYAGGGFTLSPSDANYLYQPTPGLPLLPSPQYQFTTDMIFSPLKQRQKLNAAKWDIQSAKNDALLNTAQAYFDVHRYRGQYAGAMEVVFRGRKLVEEITRLSKDLVPAVEIQRAINVLADLEQQAVADRQQWRVASAKLTWSLRLDPRAVVEPLERDHLKITLIDPERSLDDLIPIGLTNRPELAAHQSIVQAELVNIRQEKLRPLTPGVFINGFQTPYELLEFGAIGIGQGTNMNNWGSRDDITPQLMWVAQGLGFGNLARIKEARGMSSQAMVELFKIQDSVAGDITRAQADLQSAAARVIEADRELRAAIANYNGNVDGLRQTKRFGNVLVQVFRPQEAVFALTLLKRGYDNYFATVADYNQAQFALFHALGYPAKEVEESKPAGPVVPVDTTRPAALPPVGIGPPPATR